ncbi:hypothetical protein, partial [Klebsiella pneumoniae]|uniref:hypothetical protein n=1 Tax=Klebsiella pneumoniae TaxID=573 RepID=UPI0039E3A231
LVRSGAAQGGILNGLGLIPKRNHPLPLSTEANANFRTGVGAAIAKRRGSRYGQFRTGRERTRRQ